jgi:hypothetical protein
METILIEDVKERLGRTGKIKDTIIKTEVISEKHIEKKQAKNILCSDTMTKNTKQFS